MRSRLSQSALVLGVLCVSLLSACVQILAAQALDGAAGNREAAPVKKFDPAVTKVAVIPFVNELGKQDKEQTEACQHATEFAASLFAKRGFQAADPKAVIEAVEKLKLDFKDTEQRNRANFQKLADELQANLVVFGVVSDFSTHTDMALMILDARKVGRAKAEVRVYDPAAKSYCVNLAQVSEKPVPSWGGTNSLSLRREALESAIDTILKNVLKPYPEKPAIKR